MRATWRKKKRQAARSGAGAVTVLTVLLKVAKLMLDVTKLLYQAVQLVYGAEMAAARGESGAEMGCKSRRGTEGGEEVIIEVLENKASLRERIAGVEPHGTDLQFWSR